ncbi:hypothetical protein QFC20_002916 [Naganishia adeliensis]|uniref:Uncharacterized protein n=1 Tax=Naganishia adeliensis TaxID=92952 RepID=A0ACC2WGQ1_9TREE|nr:hypothetical protein QFC20_002916 [Naganishia adeliensis]
MSCRNSFSTSPYLAPIPSRSVTPLHSPRPNNQASYFPQENGVSHAITFTFRPFSTVGADTPRVTADVEMGTAVEKRQGLGPAMNSSVKFLQSEEQGGGLPTLQLVAIRMTITFIGCISYLYFSHDPDWLLGPQEVRKLLALRGFIGYQSLQYLSLSDATTLGFLSPTCTALLGAMLLNEKFTRREFIAGLVSLFGVILIARPTAIFGSVAYPSTGLPVSPEGGVGGSRTNWGNIPTSGGGRGEPTPAQRVQAVMFALMGVCGSSGAYTAIRAIGKRAKSFHSISYFSFYCVVVSVVGMIVLREPLVFPRTVIGWCLILLIGVFGLGAQLLVTMGLQREKAGRGSLAMYTQLLFATVIERVIFHTRTSFLSVLGTIIILSAALWVAFSKQDKPPSDVENRPDRDVLISSGMNTPDIVDGGQVPLSRSLGRARGASTGIMFSDSNAVPSSSRVRRSSMSKEGLMDRETPATPDALLPRLPRRQSSTKSVRSVYGVRGNGKQKQEAQELMGRETSGS